MSSGEASLSSKLARCPSHLQMEATECGAACLTMILGYFGSYVPLEEVRIAAGVSRDGSNALSLVRAAAYYGVEANGLGLDSAGLKDLPGPVVVFWNQRHYVVVEGYRRGKWHVNDPARGRYRVTDEEFDAAYSGVVLTFAPGADFRPRKGERERFTRTLLRPLHASVRSVVYALLAGLALVLPTLALSFLAGIFVQFVLAEQRTHLLGPILIGVVGVVVATLALTVLQQYVLLRLRVKLALKMSTDFLSHVLRVPVAFFHERFSGTVVSRVQINGEIAQLLSGTAATTIISLFTMIAYAAAMFFFSPLLALVSVVFAALNAFALRLAARRRVEGNSVVLKQLTRLSGIAFHGLNTIDAIKARGGESEFFTTWSASQAEYLNARQQLGIPTAALGVVPTLVSLLNTMATLALGGWLVIGGSLQISELVSFQIIAASFLAPVAQLSGIAEQLQTAHAEVQQLDDVLSYGIDPSTRPDDRQAPAEPLRKLDGRVELRAVTFGYTPSEPPLITSLSLTIPAGGRVALVGPSGSGKSTIGNLVSGLYAPWSGEILFDGKPRSEIRRSVLTSSISKVDQSIFLFEGPVVENLRLWDETVARETVIRAARDAAINEEITARAGAYDTMVAEAGRNFSGGQAQRLEIARALASEPTVLILDEATSALDTGTEREIDDALRRRGLTVLIIAHRLSTIRDADEIIVLDQGDVVQRGSHDDLMGVDGLYRELVDA